jgi:hypothetical protein
VWRKRRSTPPFLWSHHGQHCPPCANADLASVLRIVLSGPRLWPDQAQPACASRKPRSDRRKGLEFRWSPSIARYNGYVPPMLPTSATAPLPPRTALLRGGDLWFREGVAGKRRPRPENSRIGTVRRREVPRAGPPAELVSRPGK